MFYFPCTFNAFLSPIFLLIQIQLVRLLVGSLVGLLVGKSYHTKQKDGYNRPTNDPTNNRTNWILMSKKIRLKNSTTHTPDTAHWCVMTVSCPMNISCSSIHNQCWQFWVDFLDICQQIETKKWGTQVEFLTK